MVAKGKANSEKVPDKEKGVDLRQSAKRRPPQSPLEQIEEEEIDHDPVVAQQKAWDRIQAKNQRADDLISVDLNGSNQNQKS